LTLGQVDSRRNPIQEEKIYLSRRRDFNYSYCWYLHHDESGICRKNRTTRKLEGKSWYR